MTTNLFGIANVKQLWTGGSFRILLPLFRTSWGVGVLNSTIFNSFHNRVEFGTILEDFRNFGGVDSPLGTPLFNWNETGSCSRHPHPPFSYAYIISARVRTRTHVHYQEHEGLHAAADFKISSGYEIAHLDPDKSNYCTLSDNANSFNTLFPLWKPLTLQ